MDVEATGVEIRRYLDILNRQKWFIALAVVVVGLVAGIVSAIRTPVYGATARVLLQPDDPSEQVKPDGGRGASSIDPDRYVAGQEDIAESDAVAEEAAKLMPGLTAAEAKDTTSVKSSSTSDVLEISARHTDPVRARDIANAVAKGYIENRRLSAVSGLERAINDIASRLRRIQARIAELDARIGGATSRRGATATPRPPEPAADPTAADQPTGLDDPDIDLGGVPTTNEALEAARLAAATQYQSLYSRLQELLVEVKLKRGEAELISPASTPAAPVSPKPKRDGALGAAVGLLLGLGISFVREHLDDRIYSTADVERTTGLPILAEVPFDPERVKGADELPVVNRPKSLVAEAFRSLRSSLQFLQVDQEVRFIVVTSSGPGEGKSFVAANLAAACAQDGCSTLLVSADLRRPHLETVFPEAAGSDGLSGIVAQVSGNGPTNARNPSGGLRRDDPGGGRTSSAAHALVTTSVPGLHVLPAGPTPPNPSELLNSRKMSEVLIEVTRHPDVVIVDTPPLSAVTDAAILAARADGVLLVTAVGEARRDATRRSLATLETTRTRLLGVVANKVHQGQGYYGRSRDSYYERDKRRFPWPRTRSSSSGDGVPADSRSVAPHGKRTKPPPSGTRHDQQAHQRVQGTGTGSGGAMHARVSTYAGPADGVEDGIRNFEGITDSLLQLDGFQGAYLLVDRSAGRAMTITLWSSEEAAEASAERASQMRREAAGGAGLTTESVDTYEVAVRVEPGG